MLHSRLLPCVRILKRTLLRGSPHLLIYTLTCDLHQQLRGIINLLNYAGCITPG